MNRFYILVNILCDTFLQLGKLDFFNKKEEHSVYENTYDSIWNILG